MLLYIHGQFFFECRQRLDGCRHQAKYSRANTYMIYIYIVQYLLNFIDKFLIKH